MPLAGVKEVLTPSRRERLRYLPLDGGGKDLPAELAQIGVEILQNRPEDRHGYAEGLSSGSKFPCRPDPGGVVIAGNQEMMNARRQDERGEVGRRKRGNKLDARRETRVGGSCRDHIAQ